MESYLVDIYKSSYQFQVSSCGYAVLAVVSVCVSVCV